MTDEAHLFVATYNVHRAVGTDGVRNLDRIATVLHEVAADVVGLQEVDCHSKHDPALDQLARLAELSKMTAVPGPLVRRQEVSVGNGLLSRHPVRGRRSINLSVPGREPRGALDVDVETPWGMLRVVNTHLGLRGGERAQQIERLLGAVTTTGPTVILGDFNEWRWRAPNLALLHRAFAGTPALRSFPARRPLLALDRVFVHPTEALIGSQLVATEAARRASDHLPVRSILKLDAPPSGVLQA